MTAHAAATASIIDQCSELHPQETRSDLVQLSEAKETSDPPGRTEEMEELYGPKTAEPASTEVYNSKEMESLIDWNKDSPEWARKQFFDIVRKHEAAFGFDGRLGKYPAKVNVRTKENVQPKSLPMYGTSPAKKEVIDNQIDAWFKLEVIEPSKSPWGAPVVIAYRNGKPCFCVDYRKLNEVTIPDEHPISRQTEIMQALSGAQVLSSMDTLAGFTQLEIAPEDKEKTAFHCHRGLFQFRRMPFGLRNGPAIFQRIMQGILAPYLWIFTLVYIDDIVVFSKS